MCSSDLALLAKATSLDPAVVSARDILRMATGGGEIAPDLPADLALVALSSARLTPLNAPESALVYAAAAADVTGVIVAGRILMRNGQLCGVDETALLDECRAAAERLGTTVAEPFMQLSFIALSVIPELRLTDGGLVDVDRFAYVPVQVD